MSLGSLPHTDQRMPKGGRWGWYQDGEREWRPMTSLLKDSLGESTFQLEAWKMRGVLLGAAMREDLRTAALAEGVGGDTKTLNRLANAALDASKESDGATLGTAMHTICERIDAGEDVHKVTAGLPPEHRASAQAYEALLRLNGWEVVEQERTVRMSELDVAGTLDKVYRIPGYGLVIGDVKTEKRPELNLQKIGAQMGGYSRGDATWIPGIGWVTPDWVRNVNQDVGVIVHVRNGDAIPILIDLRRGYAAALSARDNLRRSQEAKKSYGVEGAWAVPMTVKRPAPAETLVAEAAARGYGRVDVDPVDAAFGTPAAVVDTTPDAKMLIERIWQAPTREVLGALYEWATEKGVPWRGPVEQAGAARFRQVECPQRELHAGPGKCACGWTASVMP